MRFSVDMVKVFSVTQISLFHFMGKPRTTVFLLAARLGLRISIPIRLRSLLARARCFVVLRFSTTALSCRSEP